MAKLLKGAYTSLMLVPRPLSRSPAFTTLHAVMQPLMKQVRRSAWFTRRQISAYLAQTKPAKLHIGCLDNFLPGWLNTEFEICPPRGAIHLDATKPFALPSATFDFVFSEHMIEHVPQKEALSMLRECHRVLRPCGAVRISTPDLRFLLKLIDDPNEEQLRYVHYHLGEFTTDSPVKTAAVVVNDYHRLWGHQFLYDESTLRNLLELAGFTNIERVPVSESRHPELSNLERIGRMPDGLLALTTLTLEAQKPPTHN